MSESIVESNMLVASSGRNRFKEVVILEYFVEVASEFCRKKCLVEKLLPALTEGEKALTAVPVSDRRAANLVDSSFVMFRGNVFVTCH